MGLSACVCRNASCMLSDDEYLPSALSGSAPSNVVNGKCYRSLASIKNVKHGIQVSRMSYDGGDEALSPRMRELELNDVAAQWQSQLQADAHDVSAWCCAS